MGSARVSPARAQPAAPAAHCSIWVAAAFGPELLGCRAVAESERRSAGQLQDPMDPMAGRTRHIHR